MIQECFDCGSKNIRDCGDNFFIDNPFFGRFSTGSNHVFKCNDCGMLLLDKKCRRYLRMLQNNKISEYLLKYHNPQKFSHKYMPESDVLGKIGFIPELVMKIKINGQNLFWKPSVDKFIKNGKDGRIQIV